MMDEKEKSIPHFLSENGYPVFQDSKFRGEGAASYTCIFGPDFAGATGKSVRQHVAWDRGKGRLGLVYTPFELEKIDGVSNPDFGYLLVLYPKGADFTIRIAHMHPDTDIDPEIRKLIGAKEPVAKNSLLGKIGSYSVTYPKLHAHSHTEVVSIETSSEILNWAIQNKFKMEDIPMEDDELRAYMVFKYEEYRMYYPDERLPTLTPQMENELFTGYKKDLAGRRALAVGKYSVLKKDYLDNGKVRTWYSSKDLLNF